MDLDEANRRLLAQVEELSGDEHIRAKVEPWKDRAPEERLLAALGQFDWALWCLERLPADVRKRAEAPEPIPDDTMAILERMRREYDDG